MGSGEQREGKGGAEEQRGFYRNQQHTQLARASHRERESSVWASGQEKAELKCDTDRGKCVQRASNAFKMLFI